MKIQVGNVYSATSPAEDWGIIDGEHITFDEKILYIEVLTKPEVLHYEDGVDGLPEHLTRPEWLWIKNINTQREHWINTKCYILKEV
jgi:hypothetical protein